MTYFDSFIIQKRSKPVCTGSHSQAATPVYSTSLRRRPFHSAQASASHLKFDAYLYSGLMKSAIVTGSAS